MRVREMSEVAAVGNPICSICFEDLRAVAEDLQSISVCGHVFHELCLQQWFEYCSSGKKKNCPVCKQACSNSNAIRLYFQSIGGIDSTISTQKHVCRDECTEELVREKKRLEAKLSGLTSASERYQKELKAVSEQLYRSKEEVMSEVQLKNEAMKQKELLQRSLCSKSEELEKSILECLRLQERNVSLAKELAALKLVSDVNLDEDDILKLASFGNEGSNKDVIDVLRKSLIIRNKNYKVLMVKCNILGRGEAKSLRKLEKAKDRIAKLKGRVQELETSIEIKANDALRDLKNSVKDTHGSIMIENLTPSFLTPIRDSLDGMKAASLIKLDYLKDFDCNPFDSRTEIGKCGSMNDLGSRSIDHENAGCCEQTNNGVITARSSFDPDVHFEKNRTCIVIDEDDNSHVLEVSERTQETTGDLVQGNNNSVVSLINRKVCHVPEPAELMNCSILQTNHKNTNNSSIDLDEDEAVIMDNGAQHHPLPRIRKESPLSSMSRAENCFKGGLVGPDGTTRYLGKWCKRSKSSGSVTSSNANSHDLIAVGADGRGGTIKTLRSLTNTMEESEHRRMPAKRCKLGQRTNAFQSKGCMMIENFFEKSS